MKKYTKYYYAERKFQESLIQQDFFEGVKGYGIWRNGIETERYPFILQSDDSIVNLYAPIREDVLDYFKKYEIAWWRQDEDRYYPSGHLLSSQNHCLNHLFAIRKDPDAVLKIIQAIGNHIGLKFDKVLPSFIDTKEAYFDEKSQRPVSNSNFISFEVVCQNKQLLKESCNKRGAWCTSVDALIYAQAGKQKWLIPIEWKYTEAYEPDNKPNNFEHYKQFISSDSRLNDWTAFYKNDPFYEFGRQTLFMEKLISEKPLVGKISDRYPQHALSADNFLYIIVTPSQNEELITDAKAFRTSLKPEFQHLVSIISPDEMLTPIEGLHPELISYLRKRYWVSNIR